MLTQAGFYPSEETAETPVIPKGKSGGWTRGKLALWAGLAVLLIIALFWGALEISRYIQVQNALRAERLRLEELAREKARHPFRYRSLVEDYAREQGLDPALVAAMILNESSFNPDAESRLGARGLMQLMPPTAEWVAGKLKEPYDFDRMYDPETNIRFGCWYLGYLSRKFDGDLVKMVAGYHAGGGAVDEWLANSAYSQDGDLTDIPYEGTDRYVQKVMNAYEIYIKHYYTSEEEAAPAEGSEGSPGAA
ncbi:MAG TPA: lytic transglycosylase domain-containing protein [Clostridia bacterium]|nr:lytic transglycosylase domain-containing protein [Clostridia bacterium]